MRRLIPTVMLVAVTALTAAPAASATTPLTGESLSGSGTASTSGHCTLPPVYGSGTFSVSGTASGPYPGSFTETGSYSFSGKQPYYLHLSASFTIASLTTTITGRLAFGYPGAWLVTGCPGMSVVNLPVNYSATIAGVTYYGTARAWISAGSQASASESFTG